MKNIMIDIETLGTKPYSVILSIGAVKFDINTGSFGDIFYRRLNTKSSSNFYIDLDTVKWWMSQSNEALVEVLSGKDDLLDTLLDLMMFVGEDKDTCVWSNSPSFDLSLIRNACERMKVDVSWQYWQERDVRTISSLDPSVRKSIPFPGNIHNAVDDCRFQIIYLVSILNSIKK